MAEKKPVEKKKTFDSEDDIDDVFSLSEKDDSDYEEEGAKKKKATKKPAADSAPAKKQKLVKGTKGKYRK